LFKSSSKLIKFYQGVQSKRSMGTRAQLSVQGRASCAVQSQVSFVRDDGATAKVAPGIDIKDAQQLWLEAQLRAFVGAHPQVGSKQLSINEMPCENA
jgi:hypothetical protein